MDKNKKIYLKIATPERIVFQAEIDQVTLPTEGGEITILPDHIPLITTLVPGALDLKSNSDEVTMAVSGGFMEFHDNELTVLADTAEKAEEINLERAEQARKRAEEMKQTARKNLDEGQYAAVVSQIEKQLARIKVADRFKKRGRAHLDLNGK